MSSVRRLSHLLAVLRGGSRKLTSLSSAPTATSTRSNSSGVGALFSSILTFHSNAAMNNRMRSVESSVMTVDGTKIHFDATGCGNHAILLLPGALGSSKTDFSNQLEHLNKDLFTVIAWDPPGYGMSYPPEREWPPKFLHRDAHLAARLMETIGFSRYSVLGWSDGGISALVMAAAYPQNIRKLVVWGANAYVTKEETEGYKALRDISSWSERMRKPFIELYGEKYFTKLWADWVDNVIETYYEQSGGDICKADLPKIACPTLIIHGEKDAMVPQFHADYLAEHIKGSRLVNMAEGKHNLHMRYFKEFNSLAESFLVEL